MLNVEIYRSLYQTFKRAKCTPLSMPDIIINHLHNLAHMEMSSTKRGRTRINLKTPTFLIGSPDEILSDTDDDSAPCVIKSRLDYQLRMLVSLS